jgi:hypothetical protein
MLSSLSAEGIDGWKEGKRGKKEVSRSEIHLDGVDRETENNGAVCKAGDLMAEIDTCMHVRTLGHNTENSLNLLEYQRSYGTVAGRQIGLARRSQGSTVVKHVVSMRIESCSEV